MFATVLTQVTGLFGSGKEFVRTYFFPTLVWLAGLAAIVVGPQSQIDKRLDQFQNLNAVLQIAWLALGLTLVAVLASVLAAMRSSVLRWYEGHWPRPLEPLANRLRTWFRTYLLAMLEKNPEAYAKVVYYQYPDPLAYPNEIMPTRLGNVLRSAEMYAYHRYGADSVLVWPRLYPLLPEEMRATVDEGQRSVDFGLIISLLGWTFSLVAGLVLVIQARPPWVFGVVFAVGWLFAFLGYQAAVASAVPYAEQIRVAFDLYRPLLLETFGLQEEGVSEPAYPLEARVHWSKLNEFFYYHADTFQRRPPPAPTRPAPPVPKRWTGSIRRPSTGQDGLAFDVIVEEAESKSDVD